MPITIIKVGKWKIMSLWADIKCKVTKKVCNKFFPVMDCKVCWQHCCTSHQGLQGWQRILGRLLGVYLNLESHIVRGWGLILRGRGVSVAVNSCQQGIWPGPGPCSWSWQTWDRVQSRPGNGVQSCSRAWHRVSSGLLWATQTTQQSLPQHFICAATSNMAIMAPYQTDRTSYLTLCSSAYLTHVNIMMRTPPVDPMMSREAKCWNKLCSIDRGMILSQHRSITNWEVKGGQEMTQWWSDHRRGYTLTHLILWSIQTSTAMHTYPLYKASNNAAWRMYSILC